MPGITLEQAEARLTAYLAAEEAVLTGQAYRMGERMLTRADLDSIQRGIEIWAARAKALGSATAGRGRARSIVPGF